VVREGGVTTKKLIPDTIEAAGMLSREPHTKSGTRHGAGSTPLSTAWGADTTGVKPGTSGKGKKMAGRIVPL
jgi:hypothetical protein